MRGSVLVASVWGVIVAGETRAQDLFRLAGGVALEPLIVQGVDPVGDVLGFDADGFLVVQSGHPSYPIDCIATPAPAGQDIDLRTPFTNPGGVSGFTVLHGMDAEAGVVQAVSVDHERLVYLKMIRCADVPAAPPLGWSAPLVSGEPIPVDFEGRTPEPLRPASVLDVQALVWPDRVCLPFGAELWCVDLEAATPALLRWTTADAVAQGMALDPTLATQPAYVPGVLDAYVIAERRWTFRAVTALPGGDVAALIHSEPTEADDLAARLTALVRIAPDGRLERVLHGPDARWRFLSDPDRELDNRRAPLSEAAHIAYDPELDALLVGNVYNWEWSGQWSVHGAPLGWFGSGLLVVDASTNGTGGWGFLGLSDAIARTVYGGMGTPDGPAFGGLRDWVPLVERVAAFAGSGLGDGVVRLPQEGALIQRQFWLRLDRDALDLDRDGLSRAAERALGTSDYAWDSDGDGLADGYERAVWGSDPARPNDDRDAEVFDRPAVAFALSPLLMTWRIPELRPSTAVSQPIGTGLGVAGPLCAGGRCFDASGAVVAEGVAAETAKSIDGRVLAWRGTSVAEAGFIWGRDLTTGECWPWAREADLAALFSGALDSELQIHAIVPESRDSLLLVVWGLGAGAERMWVVHADQRGALRVAFDLEASRCASGLGRCDPIGRMNAIEDNLLDHHDLVGRWHVAGYHAETRRLVLAIWGVWEGWLLGVSSAAPPVVLARSHELARLNHDVDQGAIGTAWGALMQAEVLPEYLRPTGLGEYFSERHVYGAHLEDAILAGAAYYLGTDPRGLGLTGAWGDAQVTWFGYELVRIERRVEPGDVIGLADVEVEDLFGHGERGALLYKVGRRGGIAPLWAAPIVGLHPSGSDVSPGGRLCVAAGQDRRLLELSPTGEDRIPSATTVDAIDLDVIDCLYESEDALLLLMVDPPRVERWRRHETATELVETLSGRPAMLVREGSGYGVIDLDGEPRGALTLADGTRLTLAAGDGSPIYDAGVELAYFDYAERYELVQRPDGLVVALAVQPADVYGQPGRARSNPYPAFYHPGRDEAVRVGAFDERVQRDGWTTLAVVPGGVGRDPWTGEPLGARGWGDEPAGDPDPGDEEATAPLGPRPTAPTGGTAVAGDDVGCAAGGPAWWVWALAWIGIAAPRRRSRRGHL